MKFNFSAALVLVMTLVSCNDEIISEENKDISSSSLDAKNEFIYDGPATELRATTLLDDTSYARFGRNGKGMMGRRVKRYDYNKTFGSFTSFSRQHLLWPGSFIQNRTFFSGNMAAVPLPNEQRNSIKVKIDAVNVNENGGGAELIQNPDQGSVQNSLGNLLDKYFRSGTSFPANYKITMNAIYDDTQMNTALDIGYTGLGSLSSKLGFKFKRNKTYFAVTLKQKYFSYSVDCDKPYFKGDRGWVKPNAHVNENPIVIETVTYGRLYVLIYESDATESALSATLSALYPTTGGLLKGNLSMEHQNVLKNTNVYVKQIGGSPIHGMAAIGNDFENVKHNILEGSVVSKDNMGAIIEYTAINTAPGKVCLPVTKKVNGSVNIKPSYRLILKNNYSAMLPLKVNNDNRLRYNLRFGELLEFPYDENRDGFMYDGKVVEQISLNGDSKADDIVFHKKYPYYDRQPTIEYVSKSAGGDRLHQIFKRYQNIRDVNVENAIDKDGINNNGNGPEALLKNSKDENNNAIMIEIKDNSKL
ncbi:thiol-activated cytolysin family protein [Chryseobacterium potabilaquae]|uniref:Thiol-activated cytolysin n=1 Tax=Chryseobacterium potabilaquae TaxID=2675057 RepID=A0A6N4X017_9FLAO|nr:thiol-activated cytolysin family protein [Chryseobacterium potabilaquae]CAA7194075.1 hypothetical protein CHRY9293_00455 [Chryseobacterium potabilaquae]